LEIQLILPQLFEKDKSMLQGLRTVIYGVSDIAAAKNWYAKAVGCAPYYDQPYYVGFNVGGYELGLDPNAKNVSPQNGGVVAYWGVADIAAECARLIALGAKQNSPVQDVGEGIQVASVLDPFGNIIGLIYNPHFKLA
jgi:predicted enzyme related to lactoylglutathione lyase